MLYRAHMQEVCTMQYGGPSFPAIICFTSCSSVQSKVAQLAPSPAQLFQHLYPLYLYTSLLLIVYQDCSSAPKGDQTNLKGKLTSFVLFYYIIIFSWEFKTTREVLDPKPNLHLIIFHIQYQSRAFASKKLAICSVVGQASLRLSVSQLGPGPAQLFQHQMRPGEARKAIY